MHKDVLYQIGQKHYVSYNPQFTCLLHRPNRSAKGKYNGNCHPCIFQVSNGGTNFCNFKYVTVFFGSLFFLGEAASKSFLNIIALTPQARALIWEFCQLLCVSILNTLAEI